MDEMGPCTGSHPVAQAAIRIASAERAEFVLLHSLWEEEEEDPEEGDANSIPTETRRVIQPVEHHSDGTDTHSPVDVRHPCVKDPRDAIVATKIETWLADRLG
jgi:hypothetical protein